MLYFDTSFLTPLILLEPTSSQIQRFFRRKRTDDSRSATGRASNSRRCWPATSAWVVSRAKPRCEPMHSSKLLRMSPLRSCRRPAQMNSILRSIFAAVSHGTARRRRFASRDCEQSRSAGNLHPRRKNAQGGQNAPASRTGWDHPVPVNFGR